MKIIELTETQFKNYSKLHSSRNYYQTVEYAHSNKGTIYYLGYINENDNTLMAAVLLLERSLGTIKFGYVPGSFLVDYNNDNLFKEFVSISDDIYSIFADTDYEDIAKIIYKIEDMNLIAAGKGFQFLSCIGSDKQVKLLDENFKDETIVKILPYLSITNISSFFENDNRAVYLFDKFFNIVNLVNYNVKFNREILLNDKFFDKLKSDSFIDFRRNINALEVNNDYLIIKKKLDKYYKELLNEYDSDSGLFKVYDEIIKKPSLMYEYRANSFIYSNDIRRIFLKHKKSKNHYFLMFLAFLNYSSTSA